MSHHSSDAENEISKHFREHFEGVGEKLGQTSRFPNGKIDEKDEGELRIAVANKNGVVIVDFGAKPVAWVGFRPNELRGFIELLQKHLAEVE